MKVTLGHTPSGFYDVDRRSSRLRALCVSIYNNEQSTDVPKVTFSGDVVSSKSLNIVLSSTDSHWLEY